MAGMSSLTTTAKTTVSLQGSNNLTPAAASPVSNNSTVTKTLSIGTAAANNAAGGSDECGLFITSVTASSSATVDFTSITDLLNTAAVTLARIKFLMVQLLSATDDATNGNAAASITLDSSLANSLTAQAHSGWFSNATSLFDIINGGVTTYGTPTAGGVIVDATHKLLKITNNDAGLTAKAQITVIGGSS